MAKGINTKKAIEDALKRNKSTVMIETEKYLNVRVPGFEKMIVNGIPKGNTVLISGGAGTGKTILGLQMLVNYSLEGKKCLYMSFEEGKDKLIQHARDFGFDIDNAINSGNLKIKKYSPLDIGKRVGAMLARESGTIPIELAPLIIGEGFEPEIILVDSLTALSSAFPEHGDYYRVYIQQLFEFFNYFGSTTFLISEMATTNETFTKSGVEEFLADGIIVMYNIRISSSRERAIEILKMRGTNHTQSIVAMKIGHDGITVYPDQEVFSKL